MTPDAVLVREEVTATDVLNRKTVETVQTEGEQERLALYMALTAIGSPPFTEKSVEIYKRVKQDQANAHFFRDMAILVAHRLTFVGSVVTLWVAFDGADNYNDVLTTLLTLASVVCLGAFFAIGRREVKFKAGWRQVPFDRYRGGVPLNVLLQVHSLRSRLPNVQLVVHELKQGKVTLDPFVAAVYGGKHVYFEVWQEDGFTAEKI